MFERNLNPWLRPAACMGALTMALMQVACAHPVDVAPSVVISSRIGHAPVVTQIGFPAPVLVMPPAAWQIPHPRVLYAPPVYVPAPVWGYGHHQHRGHGYGHGHGHGHWRGQSGHDHRGWGHSGHGHRPGWGR